MAFYTANQHVREFQITAGMNIDDIRTLFENGATGVSISNVWVSEDGTSVLLKFPWGQGGQEAALTYGQYFRVYYNRFGGVFEYMITDVALTNDPDIIEVTEEA